MRRTVILVIAGTMIGTGIFLIVKELIDYVEDIC